MKELIREFKSFVMRGNVLDLAVAVIIAGAFGLVVTSLTNDILMQLIGAVVGKPSFNDLTFTIGETAIRYGNFLTATVNFLIVSAALFGVIKTAERLQNLRKIEEVDADTPAPSDETVLLTEIRDLLKAQQR